MKSREFFWEPSSDFPDIKNIMIRRVRWPKAIFVCGLILGLRFRFRIANLPFVIWIKSEGVLFDACLGDISKHVLVRDMADGEIHGTSNSNTKYIS